MSYIRDKSASTFFPLKMQEHTQRVIQTHLFLHKSAFQFRGVAKNGFELFPKTRAEMQIKVTA